MFQEMIRQIQRAETISYTGKIENIVGMSIEASGGRAAVGDICQIYNGDAGGQVMAEVVGFKNDHILLMPYSDMSGISAGNFVRNTGRRLSLRMGPFLKGRVINALGQPIDGKGPFQGGTLFCVENNHYINPMTRPPIRERLEFGVKAIDSMLTIGKGQRIGIFAGSGVGQEYPNGHDCQKCKGGYQRHRPGGGARPRGAGIHGKGSGAGGDAAVYPGGGYL